MKKSCLGFYRKSFTKINRSVMDNCFPAIPASEVGKNYVKKADVLKRIKKFPAELRNYLIITLELEK